MVVYYVYNQAFQLFNAGYAAAIAYVVALFLIAARRRPARLQPAGRARERIETRPRLPFSPWHLVLAPVAILFALPLVWMVLSSFMSNAQINQFPPTIIPDSLHLDGWNTVLGDSDFPRWFAQLDDRRARHRGLEPRLLLARRLRLRAAAVPRLDRCSSC